MDDRRNTVLAKTDFCRNKLYLGVQRPQTQCTYIKKEMAEFRPDTPVVISLRLWVVPNIGRQFILERCIHGVAKEFQGRIRPESDSALYNQPLLVVHDDLQALELVAIHSPHPAKEGSAVIERKLSRIGTGTTRGAGLGEDR